VKETESLFPGEGVSNRFPDLPRKTPGMKLWLT
jgi:hypothetical protein